MVDQSIVKILSSKVCVSCSCLYFKDAIIDAQERHIEGTTTQIKNEHIALVGRST